MNLKQLTYPAALPVTLISVKAHLAIENDETAFDDLLADYIRAAADYLRTETHIELIETSYTAYWDNWPSCDTIKIPLWPVSSVTHVKYLNTSGVETTLSGLQTDLISCPSRIRLAASSTDWPDLQDDTLNRVRVTFVAGYGADSMLVPDMVKHAIKMLVAHWFRNRETVLVGSASKEIEHALESMLQLLRRNEFEEFVIQ